MKDRIKAVREANNMNRTRFAEKLNTSVATNSRYESGDRIPSDATLKLISKEFNVSYAWLKTGEGPMEDPVLEDDLSERLADTYQNLPDRLKMLVDALIKMDPEWYKTLDAALAEIERRQKERGAE